MSTLDFRQCAAFLDRLVDLIPAKHYLDSAAEERVEVRYLPKSERETMKQEFKKKYKESKRAKLDPEEAGGTLEQLHKQQEQKQREREEQQMETEMEQQTKKEDNVDTKADELRLKLQKRLEEMRKQRKAEETKEKVKSVKNWKEEALSKGRKKAAAQQRQGRQKMSKVERIDRDEKPAKAHRAATQKEKSTGSDFSFGKLEFGEDDGARPKKKQSKQEILEQVERDGQKSLSKDEEKRRAWKAALARAHGEKVLDDPRLLKKSIKKDAKLKDKKTKAWNERMEKVKEKQNQRQQKRKDNLQQRIDAKRERKKEKREKKLLRAGFEGRKKGFISPKS